MNRLIATLMVSAGLAASVPAVLAQTSAPQPAAATAGRPGPHAGRMHGHHAAHARSSATDRVEARLAYIHTALKITDAQRPQWDAFANVLRTQAQQADTFRAKWREQAGKREEGRHFTAIDRLERREKMMTFAKTRLDEVLTAAKPLYAALSPEQQKVADELMARQGHGRFGHRPGMHRGA